MDSVQEMQSNFLPDPMDLNALSADEKELLQKLKQRFAVFAQDYLKDDHYLLHWLKARRFDVDKAEEMLKNHLRFRKAIDMDTTLYRKNFSVNPVMARYYTRGHVGYGKLGHPVVYFPFGGIDAKGLVQSVRISEAMRTILYWIEERHWTCEAASKKFRKHISQIIYIIDLQGIGSQHLWMPGIELFKQLSQALQAHSPEIIYKLFVLNAPSIFYTIYKMVRPVLDGSTQKKINIFGSNFKEALLMEIDSDQLPVHFGGTLTGPDGDPKCSHAIVYGDQVPKALYFEDTISPPDSELTTITVSRGCQQFITVVAEKPQTELQWYFKNASANDIGFAIYRKTHDGQTEVKDMEMIVPYVRLITCFVPEWGSVKLKNMGTYVVQFDNTYSWLQSKSIKYKISLTEYSGL